VNNDDYYVCNLNSEDGGKRYGNKPILKGNSNRSNSTKGLFI